MFLDDAEVAHLVGVPYAEGGSSPEGGFDCMGLAAHIYAMKGITLPPGYVPFMESFHEVEHPEPMDLVGMAMVDGLPNIITHVGIYLGETRFIQAVRKANVGITRTDQMPWKRRVRYFLRHNGAGK